MATPAQIAANQANAKKSTGPKTEAGKAASSLNRLSHGFASSVIVMPGENPVDFKALLADFTAEYNPATATEQVLVEKMAVSQWLSLRAFRLQTQAFLYGELTGADFGVPKDLGLLIRYRSAAERDFHRAHNELVKAQKERKKSEIGFVPQDFRAIIEDKPVRAPETPVSAAPDRSAPTETRPQTPATIKIAA